MYAKINTDPWGNPTDPFTAHLSSIDIDGTSSLGCPEITNAYRMLARKADNGLRRTGDLWWGDLL